ncbi:hypothetical protein KIN20_034502 [Parelaphostrongylus tenuis]|uniref:Uncharacterized protein n=1 Tax=Parelaphostrongylus tenuis TaxID=148309 RepID=A0AAD5RAF4_PARTN|nr:hypothetical protein KIN20_034502 [Parelaphostrongylus tenuis]
MKHDENIVKTSEILPTEESYQQKQSETSQASYLDLKSNETSTVLREKAITESELTRPTIEEVEPIDYPMKINTIEELPSKTKYDLDAEEKDNAKSTRMKKDILPTKESVIHGRSLGTKDSTKYPQNHANTTIISVFLSKNEYEATNNALTVINYEQINFEEQSLSVNIVKCTNEDHVLYLNRRTDGGNQKLLEMNKSGALLRESMSEDVQRELKDTNNEETVYEERLVKTKLVKPGEGLGISHTKVASNEDSHCYAERRRDVNCLVRPILITSKKD